MLKTEVGFWQPSSDRALYVTYSVACGVLDAVDAFVNVTGMIVRKVNELYSKGIAGLQQE